MLASCPSFPASPPMCRIGTISPFRSRSRQQHERNTSVSEHIERPRPISFAAAPPPPTPTMNHTKRSSIYVSDASILLQHKNPILSPTAEPTGPVSDFVDHYAALDLPPAASIDDVRNAFRRLRGLYFSTDAKRYRAAQAAFDVLANPAARQDYDLLYRGRPQSPESTTAQAKHGRSDSAHTQASMPVVCEEEETRSEDPNWGLKRHRRLYEPVMGSQPYASYVPIHVAYEGRERDAVYGCRRPVYVGQFATYARPN